MSDVTNEQLLNDFVEVAAKVREKTWAQIEKSERLKSNYAEYTTLRAEILSRMEKGRTE